MDSDEYDVDDEASERELEIKLEISKKARLIGRRLHLTDTDAQLDCDIKSTNKYDADYIVRNPVNRSIQVSHDVSEHEVNTERVEYLSQGMNHMEGGWPKDINPHETDQTMRYRKKIEKDDNYVSTLLRLCQTMEQCIMQNNSIEIYEDYFESVDEKTRCQRPMSRSVHVFRDPAASSTSPSQNTAASHYNASPCRPVSAVAWAAEPGGSSQLAIAYCDMRLGCSQAVGRHLETRRQSYIFHISDPMEPLLRLDCDSPMVSMQYNLRDINLLAGGWYNGQVVYWDTRAGSGVQGAIALDHCHRDPVYKTVWLGMKNGAQFFTASTDGTVRWWDIRKFSEPFDTLLLNADSQCGEVVAPVVGGDAALNGRHHGATALEFEATVPTKFMVGSDQGTVFLCNRKAKAGTEKIAATYKAHQGPIHAVQRNPCFPKNFLTVGDWCARVWSEDIKESSIMWTRAYTVNLTDGCWSPTRPSVFFTATLDGCLDCWDVLYQHREPVLSIKVSEKALTAVNVHDSGLLLGVGCRAGNVTLIELSSDLASSSRADKTAVTNMFDRETRREKILEARNKELRLKEKARGLMGMTTAAAAASAPPPSSVAAIAQSAKAVQGDDDGEEDGDDDANDDDIASETMKTSEDVYLSDVKEELTRRHIPDATQLNQRDGTSAGAAAGAALGAPSVAAINTARTD